MEPEQIYILPVGDWIQAAVDWASITLHPFFSAVKLPIEWILHAFQNALLGIPFLLFVAGFALLAWRLSTGRIALFSACAFMLIGFMGVWDEAMTTLALIFTAIVLCVVIGLPLGILSARSDRFWSVLRPILDVMQTTPSFVYLVPVVMMFGVGTVPGEIAVIVVALPPLIRFTNLGIRTVPAEMVEAGLAFGATPRQLLWEVQLPLALPAIMGGLNQTVLMAMVMAVIISMIGAEGLGLTVLQGLGRLDVGGAAVGGIAIVLMAIVLDRITQAMTHPRGGRRKTSEGSAVLRALLGDAASAWVRERLRPATSSGRAAGGEGRP